MVAPSYEGETQMAACPESGIKREIPSDEFRAMQRSPYAACRCGDCDGWVNWDESPDTEAVGR